MNAVPLLLNDVATGDTLFIGDLSAAKKVARSERYVRELSPVRAPLNWRVEFHDYPDRDSCVEWGEAPTLDKAWRFALGAMFGPIDSEYDEDHLRAVLLDAALS